MTLKTDNIQLGDNVTLDKNIVLKTDTGTGDLVFVKGTHDGAHTEIARIPNSASGTLITSDDLAAPSGSSLIGYMPDGVGAVATTAQQKLRESVSVSVKDFGAVGDGVAIEATAFLNALTEMKARGGGDLHVSPGDYYFGTSATDIAVVSIADLKDTCIHAHGARFFFDTSGHVAPRLFEFIDPDRVIWNGGEFYDIGFDAGAWVSHGRQGMYCISAVATTAGHSGFYVRDVYAHDVTGVLLIDCTASLYGITDTELTGRIDTAYYGFDSIYAGEDMRVRLDCIDVRRGFIGFSPQKFDVDINLSCRANFNGSNGFVSITQYGDDVTGGVNASSGDVRLKVSGVESHVNYVHFYHIGDGVAGSMRGITANVSLDDLTAVGKYVGTPNTNVFCFDWENTVGVQAATSRTWDEITIECNKTSTISGVFIYNPSLSSAPGTLSVGPNLTKVFDLLTIFTRFQIQTPFRGTWTPVIVGTTAAGVGTYSVQLGTYTYVAGRVSLSAALTWSAHTGTGNMRIGGVPIAISAAMYMAVPITLFAANITYTAGTIPAALVGGTANKQLVLYEQSSGAAANLAMDTAGTLYASGSYPAI